MDSRTYDVFNHLIEKMSAGGDLTEAQKDALLEEIEKILPFNPAREPVPLARRNLTISNKGANGAVVTRYGNIVVFTSPGDATGVTAGSVTVGTIPTGYRPNQTYRVPVSNRTSGLAFVNFAPNGEISHYNDITYNAAINDSYCATWITTEAFPAEDMLIEADSLMLNWTGDYIADYPVEVGRSGIWTYRKWASGIAECWGHTATESIAFSNSSGYGYWIERTQSLPAGLFTSIDKGDADRFGQGSTLITAAVNTIVDNNTFRYYVWATLSGTVPCAISFDFKGRWK